MSGFEITRDEIDDGLFQFSCTNPKNNRTRYTYFLQKSCGNILFHGPDNPKFYTEFDAFFSKNGGIQHHILTHAPEASKACQILIDRWNAINWLPEKDHAYLRRDVSNIKFHMIPEGKWLARVKPVPLPGHMPGFTGYLVKFVSKSYLICGDFIGVGAKGEGWRAAVGHLSLRDAGFNSLQTIASINFDGFLPNKSVAEKPPPWSAALKDEIFEGANRFLERKFKIKSAAL